MAMADVKLLQVSSPKMITQRMPLKTSAEASRQCCELFDVQLS